MTASSPRSDAVRNKQRILAAARESFVEQGAAASLDAIAKRAGIGPGTLYRHFPNRAALVAGLLSSELGDLAETHATIKASPMDPAARLDRWADALIGYMTRYRGLPDPLRAALDEPLSPLSPRCEIVIDWTEALVAAARDAGLVKDFVTGRDFYRASLGVAWVASGSDDGDSVRALLRMSREGWATSAVRQPDDR